MQLGNLGVQLGDRNLWDELVEHLQSHLYTRYGSTHLKDYLSAPVAGDDPFNADTEAPSEQDECINSIEDPELQQQLRWLQYLERYLGGDHIAVQGLADMLHIDIHIINPRHMRERGLQ